MNQNVFEYAATCERKFEMALSDCGNYKRKTTFYSDLSIAEWYGAKDVIDTYRRVMKEWLGNIEYITEFVLCLNWKCWEHHGKNNMAMSQIYSELYYKSVDEVLEHYKGNRKALDYYYEVTD